MYNLQVTSVSWCARTNFNTLVRIFLFFFFNDTATTEIYTLSLHDALPICVERVAILAAIVDAERVHAQYMEARGDRKSTRLNSSHLGISYAVFCLKKKKKRIKNKRIVKVQLMNSGSYGSMLC